MRAYRFLTHLYVVFESDYLYIMNEFASNGFAILDDFYSGTDVEKMKQVIEAAVTDKPTFRRTNDLFAIRQVLKEIPELHQLVFNQRLKQLISEGFGDRYFVSKSIYFDKPGNSNWFVAWHQDITISVKDKIETTGFGPWTKKQDQYAVQPPVNILQQNFTVRIHLDPTDESNGALKVLPGSHLAGIRRFEELNGVKEDVLCAVAAGGIMLMHPLLFHASGRSSSNTPRRVLHIEFSNQELPEGLSWSEKFIYE